ncbi:MAG: ATP-binding protein, partial [Planctomycetota bacterium]|nr:ATP-binding protein [Planctomycetota bacterium]
PRVWSEEEQGFAGSIGDLVALVLAASDRRKLELKMRQAQKLESLGVLAGGIAHDFNNLLVGVLGNTSRLLSKLDKTWPNREMLNDIAEAAKQASELTDQLLAYSGSGRFTLEPISLNNLINDMAHLSEKVISNSFPIHYELEEKLPLIEGDPTQLRQVIMNLLTNASEAIDNKKRGEITLRTGTVTVTPENRSTYITSTEFREGEQAFLEVQDNGPGIPPDHIQKLFDPFFTTKFTGRGLGLAAVMGVVNSHHGAISVETGKEKGTTFRILLPTTKKEKTIRKKDPKPVINQKGKGLILVIDDDQIVRRVCRAILKDHGYEVITCSTGGAALNVFEKRASKIDAIILDLTMPETSGKELFHSLREISPDVPILLTSGYSAEHAEEIFPPGSVAGFLKKPYDITTFMEKVTEALPKG